MQCLQKNMTHLHQKWCVHSILPLVPRAKQPDFHVHAQYTLQDVTATLTHSLNGAVELVRFVLAAGASERIGPNMSWLPFSFVSGLRRGWGEIFHLLNVSETATHITGHYVSQQCQMRMRNCAFLQHCAWDLLRRTRRLDLNKRTENFLKFWQNSVCSLYGVPIFRV
jgi:hypothetical protein